MRASLVGFYCRLVLVLLHHNILVFTFRPMAGVKVVAWFIGPNGRLEFPENGLELIILAILDCKARQYSNRHVDSLFT